MKANHSSQKAKVQEKANTITDHQSIPHDGLIYLPTATVDYSMMRAAVKRVGDPVDFQALKAFFGMT